MIVVTVAHRSIKIVNKLLRLRIVGFVTLLSSDRIINCYQVPSRHHVKVRVLPASSENMFISILQDHHSGVNLPGKNETKNGVERFKHSNNTNTRVTDDEEAGAKTRF